MKKNRRQFIKKAVAITATSMIYKIAIPHIGSDKSKTLSFRYRPYNLDLKHVFTLANSSRKTTPVMLIELEFDGIIGFGEASMPPYLGENQQTAADFYSKIDLEQFSDPFRMDEILNYVDEIDNGNHAAKASIDIALHDLVGKLLNKPWHKIWGLSQEDTPDTSFTIGIDKPDVVRQKVKEAAQFKILKIKLGAGNDKEMIETIRSVSNVPLCVDVNQGWKDKQHALEMIYWLKEQGVVFVEQPMSKTDPDGMSWLTQHSPLPTIADEALQRLPDVLKAHQVYSGINIKLMKCTGMREAYKMITLAKSLEMKVMIGCMTETSCAVSAAAQLAPLAEWADLDGNLLIKNDVFEGVKIIDGKVTLNDLPGIGIKKR